jgi:hypothetical protein
MKLTTYSPKRSWSNTVKYYIIKHKEKTMEDTAKRELTFGERAVGLTFNPSANADVQAIKEEFAAVIDHLNDLRVNTRQDTEHAPEVGRMLSIAITDLQTAQMWAVKAVTWETK